MSSLRLLCTDLDRTLLPNGDAPEAPGARERLFARLRRDDVKLAFVTGRHRELVEEAIATWELPRPDYVVADVGSTIYRVDGPRWMRDESWFAALREDWPAGAETRLDAALVGLGELTSQATERQNPFKRSWYAPIEPRFDRWREALEATGLRTRMVHSIDEHEGVGLLDVLPANAGKEMAVLQLRVLEGIDLDELLFAGDSGNDLEALAGPFPSVLVGNASEEVRAEARRRAGRTSRSNTLFCAGQAGRDGNYAAGILEGIDHFWPEVSP